MNKNAILTKEVALIVVVWFIGMSFFPVFAIGAHQTSLGPVKTLYVGGSGPGNYSKIQDGIDNASDGDTVFVYDDSSPYYENIVVDKPINLIGENMNSTVIDNEYRRINIINISSNRISITGFTIKRSGYPSGPGHFGYFAISSNADNINISYNKFIKNCRGIRISGNNITIANNIILDTKEEGILLSKSHYNTITNNTISTVGGVGILLGESNHNIITKNIIYRNGNGIHSYDSSYNTIKWNNITRGSIAFYGCKHFHISKNNIANNGIGIRFDDSDYFLISFNNIEDNKIGLLSIWSANNKITNNNFIENSQQHAEFFTRIIGYRGKNIWDGNYWNSSRSLPYPIFGKIGIYNSRFPWLNFDWHPAKEPYDIPTSKV